MNSQKICTKNATFQKFEVLKSNRYKRHRYNQFFVEGVRNINEAIKNKWHICSFLYSSNMKLTNWAKSILNSVKTEVNYDLSPELLIELSSKTDTSELLAIVRMRDDDLVTLEISEKSTFVLFDRPSNKGNLGTIIRSCDSFGIDALLLTGHAVDLYDPEVISASMGSFFNVPVIRLSELNKLFDFVKEIKARYPDFSIIGTTAHNEKNICDMRLKPPLMLMLGNVMRKMVYARDLNLYVTSWQRYQCPITLLHLR